MQVHPIANHATLPDMPSATNTDHDGRYYTEDEIDTMLGDASVDHGALGGLDDNDHGAIYYTETEIDDFISNLIDGTTAFTGIDIDGGSIDGAIIGATTPAAGSFTSLVVDTTTLVANATGYEDRVGIGTATPVSLLHLSGVDPEIRMTDTGDSEYTRITRADTDALAARYNRVEEPAALQTGLAVNGSTGYIDLTTSNNFLNDLRAGKLAIVQVLNVDSSCGDWKQTTSAETAANVGFRLFKRTGATQGGGWGGTDDWIPGAITVSEDEIHNVAIVFDVSDDTIGWFLVDGVLRNTDASVSGLVPVQATLIRLGARADNADWKATAKFGFFAVLDLSDGITVDQAFAASLSAAINTACENSGYNPEAIRAAIMAVDGAITGAYWKLDDIDNIDSFNITNGEGTGWDAGSITGGVAEENIAPAGADTEVLIWSSQDGTGANEEGIQTFGDGQGRTVIDGQTIRFNIGGVEKAQIDSSGTLAVDTVDIDGGTIDAVTIGTNSACTELQVDEINIDGNTISVGEEVALIIGGDGALVIQLPWSAAGQTCEDLGTVTAATSITSTALISDTLVVDTTTLVVNATGYEDRVGIGTAEPNAPLEVEGSLPGIIGGFHSGLLHVTTADSSQFANAVITGHNSYNTNTQLWYLGSTSGSNDDIAFINRQDGALFLKTNNITGLTITKDGTTILTGGLSIALTGTVTTDGTVNIVGDSTLFESELVVGDAIKIESNIPAKFEIFTVSAIADDLNLTLDSAYAGEDASGLDAWSDPDLFIIDNGDGTNYLTCDKSGTLLATNQVLVTANIAATSGSTGSLVVTGGIGLGGRICAANGASLGDGGATNFLDIASDGTITLQGTARVLRHIRIGAGSWKPGVAAPTPGFSGNYPHLSFAAGSDEAGHYEIIIPHRRAAGTDIHVVVEWYYAGAQDNGTVEWNLTYISTTAGGNPLAAGTNISKTSAGNHTTGQLVRTEFDTYIDSDNITNEEPLGMKLWRDGSNDTNGKAALLISVHLHFVKDKLGQAT